VRFGERGPFDVRALKTRIVHVSDELQLAYDVDPTVEQVVASGFTASIGMIERPDDAAREVVSDVVARLRLQPLSGRRFSTLSFGERRKVLIARGLVRRPDVLILDEIWSGLDAAFRAQLDVLLVEQLAQGTTLVAISHHDDDLPPYVRRAYTIEDGRLTASSSPGDAHG
jgi:ABC-type molybdenum transport system ATPase subunit/photorepair protein PhrA